MKHPIQPVIDDDGIIRFKKNAIVRYILDHASRHGCDLNDLALIPFDNDDRTQLAQLIGYSVSGAGELDYFDRKVLAKADAEAEKLIAQKKRKKRAREV